jgi:hypothetical protein
MLDFIFQNVPQVTPPAGMTVEQLVSGVVGTMVPFLAQIVRNQVIELKGLQALALSIIVSAVLTLWGYLSLDTTPTTGEFLTNLSVCFASAQLVYNSLQKGAVSQVANLAVGLPTLTGTPQPELEKEEAQTD